MGAMNAHAPEPLLIRDPSPAAPRALVLLLHGVGASPTDLVPLGRLIADAHPAARVMSLPGTDASDLGTGRQWFSVQGVTDEDRPRRVAAAMPAFAQAVEACQHAAGIGADRTVLVGFSQGAIMALESTRILTEPPARTVVAIAGRYAVLPQAAAQGVQVHLVHGDADAVMAVQLAHSGEQRLRALGAAVSLDVIPGLGHGIDMRAAQAVLARLSTALD